ncbi:outer membrane protein assembly factor BamB [Nitrosomonas sp. Is24]|uniref:outer membrane protein assembly factor BamB n=1 Tax=Nitrosomonas sp. Is24 TaxID=3080533 RepID=UPI00294B689A|nr:outer membrane protein assembly factor BamB [Nitrosomonas sp. Is24]MDV6341674.1 outer membrane protein assembly factor BamB [Nitrosomonas sp. Is24]
MRWAIPIRCVAKVTVLLNFARSGRLFPSGLIVALLLSGCSTFNPFDMRIIESMSTGISDLLITDEPIVYEKEELDALKKADRIPLKWKDKAGENEIASFYTAFDNGAVYVADEAGKLTKYNAATGKQEWQVKSKNKFSAGVGIGEGLILIGTFKGEVLAYNESGHMLWQASVTSEILSPPQVQNNVVAVRTVDGRIFALDAIDGKRKWIYQGATPSLTVRSTAGITLAHGAIFAGFPGGKMVAMSLFNGNIGWEVAVSQPRGVTELERMTDITSAPVMNNRLVCAVAYQGRVACFAINDGAYIWSRESSSSAGLVMDNDYVYVTEDNGVVAAYDLLSGAGMWKQSRLGSKKLTRPVIIGQYIVVADDQGFVNVLRNYDGALVARAATDGSVIHNAASVLPDGFVVQTAKGGVYAFSTQF